MDPEVKKALANIRRRQKEIERKYGRTEDDGPLFGRRNERRQYEEEQAFFDDLEDLDEGL